MQYTEVSKVLNGIHSFINIHMFVILKLKKASFVYPHAQSVGIVFLHAGKYEYTVLHFMEL